MVASHSIFNYSIFLSLLPNRNLLPARHLLILDEAHLVETEIVKFRGYPYLRRGGKGISKILKLLIMVTTLMVG
jgi:ATP-dependent DNA helicase DinG